MINEVYSVFAGQHPEELGYGVTGSRGGTLYEANFKKDTADRIAQLENSANPPKDWEATSVILEAEGYDVAVVTSADDNEVSAGRLNRRPDEPTAVTMKMGAFQLEAAIDCDGHLTVIVKSTDGSPAVDIEDEVGCNEGELGYRFTTEKIEAAVDAT
jgi:hypothetical protein